MMFRFLKINEDLIAKSLSPEESDLLFTAVNKNRSFLRRWLSWLDQVKTSEDSLSFISKAQTSNNKNQGFVAGIWFKKELVGTIGFNEVSADGLSGVIGYWLSEHVNGQGIISQTLKGIIEHIFSQTTISKITIRCAEENTQSRKIPEKLGFKELEGIREKQEHYGNQFNLVVYERHK